MSKEAFALQVWFEVLCDCCVCGEPIVVPSARGKTLRAKGGQFFCINGHSQSFTETENMKLKRQLEERDRLLAESRAETKRREEDWEKAQRSAAAYRGKLTEVKNRVGRGVCPCCNRTFQNLMAHMQTKHPGFK